MLSWGVLGLGNIAHRFCESLQNFSEARFYAGASHTPARREEFKEKYHPVKLYDDYEAFLNDEEIDVVYIALPHQFHYQWVMKALQHNKCVLVEKPAFLTKKEAEEATTYAREHSLFFMEAMKSRFIPLNQILNKEIEKGLIGDVQYVENYFTFNNIDNIRPGSYLLDKRVGGSLYDCGVYNIASILDVIHSKVTSIENEATFRDGVDIHDRVKLTFENGAKAYFECAMDDDRNRRDQVILGSKGKISMNYFYRPTSAICEYDGESQTVTRELDDDDFHSEIAAVHEAISYIQVESARMSHQDTIDEASLLERIHEVTYRE